MILWSGNAADEYFGKAALRGSDNLKRPSATKLWKARVIYEIVYEEE